MPANTTPIFVLTANRGTDGSVANGARLTNVGNATRDLSTTVGASQLYSAGANGSRIESITFTHTGTAYTISVACVGRVWLCTSSAGANPRLIAEVALPAVTPSSIAIGQQQSITFTTPLFIPSGMYLWTAVSVAQGSALGYDVSVNGGDY